MQGNWRLCKQMRGLFQEAALVSQVWTTSLHVTQRSLFSVGAWSVFEVSPGFTSNQSCLETCGRTKVITVTNNLLIDYQTLGALRRNCKMIQSVDKVCETWVDLCHVTSMSWSCPWSQGREDHDLGSHVVKNEGPSHVYQPSFHPLLQIKASAPNI